MTAREAMIAKKILDVLHDEDGRQVHAITIHGQIGGIAVCSVTTFEAVLAELETRRFVNKLKTKFKGDMWNITDAGEAARLEMA